jgi:hypothetical protein
VSQSYLKISNACSHLQTLSVNSVGIQFANKFRPSFVRICKQSANKYSMFMVSRWKWEARYNVCRCGRVDVWTCGRVGVFLNNASV